MNKQQILEKIYDTSEEEPFCIIYATLESVGFIEYQRMKLRYSTHNIHSEIGLRNKRTLRIHGIVDEEFHELEGKDPRELPFSVDKTRLKEKFKEIFPKHEIKFVSK